MTIKSDDGRILLEAILVDKNGDEISIVGGELAIILPTDAATETKQDSQIVELQSLVNALTSEGGDTLQVTAHAHQQIHDKKSWTMHFSNNVTNINEQTVIAFNAPPANKVHMVISIESTHDADVYLYRDTSIDVDEGTQLTPLSRNQTAPLGVSTITSIENPPVSNRATTLNETEAADANITTSTELDHLHLLGGEGPKALGAAKPGRETEEWIFDDGTQVAVIMNANTDDNAIHIIRIDYYEE